MSRQVIWTSIIIDEFVKLAVLSKEEEQILRTRAAGWTITKQSLTFGMSKSTIDKMIKRLKQKYDMVQPYSPLLPKRKLSAKELYMDNN